MQFCYDIRCMWGDLILDNCYPEQCLLQPILLIWSKHVRRTGTNTYSWKKLGVIPLDEATKCCDTSCRDDVTPCNNWKFYCSIVRGIAQKKTDFHFSWQLQQQKLLGMSVAGCVTMGNFFLQLVLQQNCKQITQVIPKCNRGFGFCSLTKFVTFPLSQLISHQVISLTKQLKCGKQTRTPVSIWYASWIILFWNECKLPEWSCWHIPFVWRLTYPCKWFGSKYPSCYQQDLERKTQQKKANMRRLIPVKERNNVCLKILGGSARGGC